MTEEQIEQIIKDCQAAVSCKRGEFYPDKNFGNRIIDSDSITELLSAARLAVREISGVHFKNGRIDGRNLIFTALINDEERTMIIDLEKDI